MPGSSEYLLRAAMFVILAQYFVASPFYRSLSNVTLGSLCHVLGSKVAKGKGYIRDARETGCEFLLCYPRQREAKKGLEKKKACQVERCLWL